MILFSATATYDFLAIEDASKDKVMDVVFVLKNTQGSQNNTCDDAGIKCYSILIYTLIMRKRRVGLLSILQLCITFVLCNSDPPCVFQVCPRHVCLL